MDDIRNMPDADLVHADHDALVREVVRLRQGIRDAVKNINDASTDDGWWYADLISPLLGDED